MCVLFSTEWLAERMYAAMLFDIFCNGVREIRTSGGNVSLETLAERTKISPAEIRKYAMRNPCRMRYLGISIQQPVVEPRFLRQPSSVAEEILFAANRYNTAKEAASRHGAATIVEIARLTDKPAWAVESFAKERPELFSL